MGQFKSVKLINGLGVKAKFQIDQCKSLKQVFYRFGGQFDLEGQGQGHNFLNSANDQYIPPV